MGPDPTVTVHFDTAVPVVSPRSRGVTHAGIGAVLALLVGVAAAKTAGAAPVYSVLDLGGGAPVAIDDAGRVAGTRLFSTFLTQPGQAIRPEDLLPDNVRAVDMSPGGTLVGTPISSSNIESPVVWNGTSWQSATTTPGEDWDDVSSVNDAGRVAGGGLFA